MQNNYIVKKPNQPENKSILKHLKNDTLQNILNFSKSLEVVKGKTEVFELMLN
ncbi:MAG: hypothetical protein ACWA41_09300 [Putridiphycobacter sp.]